MRKFLIAIFLMLGIVFILGRISEVESMAKTLQQGDWRFLLLAAGLILAWMVVNGAQYRTIFLALGIPRSLVEMSLVGAAASFANTVAPAAGASGLAVLVTDARQRGHSTPRAALAAALFIEFDYLGFIIVLATGLIVLLRRNDLSMVELSASAMFLGVAVALGFLIYLGTLSAGRLQRALVFLARLANRLLRPFNRAGFVSEDRAANFAHDAAEGLRVLRNRPRQVLITLVLALSSKVLLILVLALVFLAFQTPIAIGTVIASYSIAQLFLIISPTPAGLGVVEGVLALSLMSMYVEKGAATVITLAYRALTFWLPLLVGMIVSRFAGQVGIRPNQS
jgi:hypothetical protein